MIFFKPYPISVDGIGEFMGRIKKLNEFIWKTGKKCVRGE